MTCARPSVDQPTVRVAIREEPDVAMARKYVRQLAQQSGLSETATHSMATAVSEIARNILVHAGTGELTMHVVDEHVRRGLIVVAHDAGPGIVDLDLAIQDGFTTAHGLGLGLSSARRLVDDFELASATDRGTTVILKKWAR